MTARRLGDSATRRAAHEFLEASFWYGGVDTATAILEAHPELIGSDIYVAAALGDHIAVQRFLEQDASLATEPGGPRNVDALTYLCFSRFLAHDPSRSEGLVRAARMLLDAGADPNGGFFDDTHRPHPERESVLYGAAGVAHHAGMTRLLLERGANPNDEEVPYHAPETYDNEAFMTLLDSGQMSPDSLLTMLLRKSDWHDYDGIKLALDHGADVNGMGRWGNTVLLHAILRDNRLAIIELVLDRGGDPRIASTNLAHRGPPRRGMNSIALAAHRGRGDVLDAMKQRDVSLDLDPVDSTIAACARGRADEAQRADGEMRNALRVEAGMLLCEFAGNDNAAGVACLLDLGLRVDAPYDHSDGYYDVTPKTTPLLNAAWRASHDAVELLVNRGADVNARDSKGRTPLVQAIRAATESYWKGRRSPRSVKALLDAGANTSGVSVPTGYAAIDELLPR